MLEQYKTKYHGCAEFPFRYVAALPNRLLLMRRVMLIKIVIV